MNGNKLIEGITSESVKKLNPQLFTPRQMGGQKPEPTPAPTLGRDKTKQGRGAKSLVVINIIALRRRLLDDDNNIGSYKPLRDVIARFFEINDGDPAVKWEYGQCLTTGQPETIVRIEMR